MKIKNMEIRKREDRTGTCVAQNLPFGYCWQRHDVLWMGDLILRTQALCCLLPMVSWRGVILFQVWEAPLSSCWWRRGAERRADCALSSQAPSWFLVKEASKPTKGCYLFKLLVNIIYNSKNYKVFRITLNKNMQDLEKHVKCYWKTFKNMGK